MLAVTTPDRSYFRPLNDGPWLHDCKWPSVAFFDSPLNIPQCQASEEKPVQQCGGQCDKPQYGALLAGHR